jgi:hypothetical protein
MRPFREGFGPIKPSLCDINTQRFVKMSGTMNFIEFSSFKKRVENLR